VLPVVEEAPLQGPFAFSPGFNRVAGSLVLPVPMPVVPPGAVVLPDDALPGDDMPGVVALPVEGLPTAPADPAAPPPPAPPAPAANA